MLTPELDKIYQGDCIKTMQSWPDSFVHCVVTSPPYWALRDYGVKGQIGLEPTFEEFLAKLVDVFREVRRILRPDGTLWLNMGDCYNAGTASPRLPSDTTHGRWKNEDGILDNRVKVPGLKPKDLVGQPWRLAFALQADGWYLRQDIIWHKKNPMPESVSDRCTKAHEYLFLLSKSERYYYDAEAISEPVSLNTHSRGDGLNPKAKAIDPGDHKGARPKQNASMSAALAGMIAGRRNRRSVWTLTSRPFPEAHFATFPEDLVAPCILAGTSEYGVCSVCGAQAERQLEVPKSRGKKPNGWNECEGDHNQSKKGNYGGKWATQNKNSSGQRILKSLKAARNAGKDHATPFPEKKTIGWKMPCAHDAIRAKAIVCDPFSGAATTAYVSDKLNRSSIGCELNGQYIEIGEKRRVLERAQGKLL